MKSFMDIAESVPAFARRINRPTETVRAWVREPGGAMPDFETISELAEILDCSPYWLQTGLGPKSRSKFFKIIERATSPKDLTETAT
jgi:hypothetical protein